MYHIVASGGDEEEALKEAEELNEDLNKELNEDGTITLHKSSFSNKKRMALRKYIHFLDTDENFKRGMVDIFIDDFVTSGATIEAAMYKLGERDGSTFGVAMFRVK